MSAADLVAELRDDPAALLELRELLGTTPTVYSCSTLAEELGCTPRAIRAAIERGELAAVRSGGRYVIAADAVRAWATPVGSPRRMSPRRGTRTMRDAVEALSVASEC